jgi:ankyrin repeat protein
MGMFSKLFGNKLEKALLSAAKKGDLAEVRSLLDNNPELDLAQAMTSIFGNTALHLAAENRHTQLVEFLIDKGAEVNATTKEGSTPLHLTALKGQGELAEVLLARGADVQAEDNNGNTPLHGTAFKGHTDVAELLLSKGADVNAKNKSGATPLGLAKDHAPTKDVVEFLQKHGGTK